MIRAIEVRDVPKLREMGFAWEFGSDYLTGVVKVDANDQPLMVMAAWAKAEVHMASREYSTPATRWSDLQRMHEEMERQLAKRGVREVMTFFEKGDRFCRRLFALNWIKSELFSIHREVRHGQ